MSVLFSGIQPTGNLHIGNYLGALKQWVELQKQHQCFFSIVDLHAFTTQHKPDEFKKNIMEAAVDLLALGVDPNVSILFIQSHVPAHVELGWLLNCLTPLAELERMTQFKDKSAKEKSVNAGLLTYPCLMAADILLYHAEVVPVGEDQLQHLELARLIARKLNKIYKTNLPEPKPLLVKQARVMSLIDPKRKMSKSNGPSDYIAMRDEPDVIRRKVAKAVTDSGDADSAGVKNLFNLLEAFAPAMVVQQYKKAAAEKSLKYSELKQILGGAISAHFETYRAKVKELEVKPDYVKQILVDGAAKAKKVAAKNLKDIQEKVGLI